MFSLIELISTSSIGLGLFLLGMNFLTEGFNNFISHRLKNIILNLKVYPIVGVLIGAIATAILQSSSGITVILVGLVHANVLTLHQATPILMGANIGTTMTSQLLAFNVDQYAFIPFILGMLIILTTKNKKLKYFGNICLGLSLIFIGINLLTNGLSPLKDLLAFQKLLGEFGKNPLLGILLGFSTISILQSSSTGVVILQTLGSSGSISIDSAVAIILGMNVGTCVTAIISSLSLNKAAKQTALIHFLFNVLGVLLIFPFIGLLCRFCIQLSPLNVSRQIANAHTIFNIFNTLVLLPFIGPLVTLSQKIIRNPSSYKKTF
ncbi:Na/Pi cotransporter family protein [Alkaliphilus oremlandii]|uniref:Na/Pi cotransporter family protein n=1 Tax=Alkaliphilus oremlandii TaxID=461876 RepID=UPI0038CC0BD7